MKKLQITLIAITTLCVLGDIVTTSMLMGEYLTEGNPVASFLMQHDCYYTVKIATLLMAIIGLSLLNRVSRPYRVVLIAMDIVACLALLWAVYNNIDLLIKINEILEYLKEAGVTV